MKLIIVISRLTEYNELYGYILTRVRRNDVDPIRYPLLTTLNIARGGVLRM